MPELEVLTREIQDGLRTVFGESERDWDEWLDARQELLGGKTPREMISTAEPENLRAVRGLLERVTG